MYELKRKTKETDITCRLDVSKNKADIKTSIPFFNHMLEAFFYYAKLPFELHATGDIDVDDHHLVEDCGIVLGKVLRAYIDDLKTYQRFSSCYLVMDEALSRVVLDISNRPFLHYKADFINANIQELTLQNVKEFFKAFAIESRITLHMETLYGDNDHHKVESLFKACGIALKDALLLTDTITSTKGVL
jgi:imidazoleglycerol-phosphate dehydratase